MGRHEPKHTTTPDAAGPDTGPLIRRTRLLLAAVNTAVAAAWLIAPAGQAPSILLMQQVAPLHVWGIGLAVAALLLFLDRPLAAHMLAVALWGFWAASAVLGAAAGSTRSPAVTLALTSLVLAMAGVHVHGLLWRHAEAQARRAT